MHALLLSHRVENGRRDDVRAVWNKHMLPAVSANPDHLIYVYAYPEREDEICAFQVYRSRQAAAAFLESAPYQAYLEDVASLLRHPPEVTALTPEWLKVSDEVL